MSADLWSRGCARLAAELPEQQFNTWIRPLPCADFTELADGASVATVRVPNRFKLDWIRNQYASRIEAVLSELAGKPVRLDLTLAPREVAAAVQGIGTGNHAAVSILSAEQGDGSVPTAQGVRRNLSLVPSPPPAMSIDERPSMTST